MLTVAVRIPRIIEIEWAVKNNRPFKTSPKKPRRSHSKRDHGKGGKSKRKAMQVFEPVEEDTSEKENVDAEASSSGKRRIKAEDAELGTPPRKKQMVKMEE